MEPSQELSLEDAVTMAVIESASTGKVKSTTYQLFLNLDTKGLSVYEAIKKLQDGSVLMGYFAFMSLKLHDLEFKLLEGPDILLESVRDAIIRTETWDTFATEEEKYEWSRRIVTLREVQKTTTKARVEVYGWYLPPEATLPYRKADSPTGLHFHFLNKGLTNALVEEIIRKESPPDVDILLDEGGGSPKEV